MPGGSTSRAAVAFGRRELGAWWAILAPVGLALAASALAGVALAVSLPEPMSDGLGVRLARQVVVPVEGAAALLAAWTLVAAMCRRPTPWSRVRIARLWGGGHVEAACRRLAATPATRVSDAMVLARPVAIRWLSAPNVQPPRRRLHRRAGGMA